MRERIARFMQGRYGMDQFTNFLGITAMVFWLIGRILRIPFLYMILQTIALLLILYADIRILSRNHVKRYQENEKYLVASGRIRRHFQHWRNRVQDRKWNRIFKCPSCGQKIRVPKGKGKIAITCPQCRTEFVRKS